MKTVSLTVDAGGWGELAGTVCAAAADTLIVSRHAATNKRARLLSGLMNVS
jgi:hypothetical protein